MLKSKKLLLAMAACSIALATMMAACGARYDYRSDYGATSSAASSANERQGMDVAVASAAPEAMPMNSSAGEGNSIKQTDPALPTQERKLVKVGDMSLETKEFDTSLEAIVKMVTAQGGYIDRQSVDGKSMRYKDGYYERSASVSARIPADKLDTFTGQLGEMCNVISQSEGIQDITDSYYDAQSRLDMLKVKEARLLDLLSKAEKLEDIIKLEDALSTCQYELDSLTGQLRRMDNQVSYSTMNIQLFEVVEYNEMKPQPKTFGEKMSEALSSSGRRLVDLVQDTLLWLIELGPVTLVYLAFWVAVILLCYLLYKRLRKGRAGKSKQPPAAVPEQKPQDTDNTD